VISRHKLPVDARFPKAAVAAETSRPARRFNWDSP
jgi:hypothetical protein